MLLDIAISLSPSSSEHPLALENRTPPLLGVTYLVFGAHQAGSSARQLGALSQGGVCARSELARQPVSSAR